MRSNTSIITPVTDSPQAPIRRRRAQSVQAVQGISRIYDSDPRRRLSLFESNVSFRENLIVSWVILKSFYYYLYADFTPELSLLWSSSIFPEKEFMVQLFSINCIFYSLYCCSVYYNFLFWEPVLISFQAVCMILNSLSFHYIVQN